ncbi:unnamed protein product [Clonostachys solani]|uniref:Uncharacterized protein n=1 Tax=Clonostachys solani TaxID=160281 RepID=A0A9N9Z455_9HYPO|nr:unnamed protein product [Clonostachys solani]
MQTSEPSFRLLGPLLPAGASLERQTNAHPQVPTNFVSNGRAATGWRARPAAFTVGARNQVKRHLDMHDGSLVPGLDDSGGWPPDAGGMGWDETPGFGWFLAIAVHSSNVKH